VVLENLIVKQLVKAIYGMYVCVHMYLCGTKTTYFSHHPLLVLCLMQVHDRSNRCQVIDR